ncbi:MAG TPA: hypothetical protein VEN81_12600 [Planctomycetota bacterium]|jgi:hypothetical protein|nr:hypothetical protein [Planctomycetota bacterium]
MKTLLTALAASLATAAAAGSVLPTRGAKPSVYTDSVYGFSIQAPAFPPAATGSSATPVMLVAPSEDNFASNVNVMVLNAAVSLEDYQAQSLKEFKAMGLKENSETKSKIAGRDAIVWDYEGKLQGNELRWLAAAIAAKDKVYLITCTTLKKHFEKHEKEFRACLESFKLSE